MIKILGVGGVCASGKSTLIKEFMAQSEWVDYKPYDLIYGHYSEDWRMFVIGIYKEGDNFPGGDKLSMAVAPKFKEYIQKLVDNDDKLDILFEGDRLFTADILEFLTQFENKIQCKFAILESSKEQLKTRHFHREDTQNEKFLKSRATKYKNILSNMELMSYLETWKNEDKKDLEINLCAIKEFYIR